MSLSHHIQSIMLLSHYIQGIMLLSHYKTKMESNKRREGMYNIIDFQLMGGLSEHKNGGPSVSMNCRRTFSECIVCQSLCKLYKRMLEKNALNAYARSRLYRLC
jgi:hypothetical protein